ncbi:MAG: DUF2059 domain-containing protein [Opitutales bacterium]
MKRLKVIFLLATIAGFLPALSAQSPAAEAAKTPADNSARHDLAQRMIDAFGFQEQYAAMLEPYKEMTLNMVRESMAQEGIAMNAEQEAVYEEYLGKLFEVMYTEMNLDALEAEMVRIYAQSFTEGELRAAVDFFESAAGKAFMEKSPTVSAELLQYMQTAMSSMMPKLQSLMQEMAEALHEAE